MSSVFWDSRGVILANFLQNAVTITGAYYDNLISKFREVNQEKCYGNFLKSVFLHYHNVHVHHCKNLKQVNAALNWSNIRHIHQTWFLVTISKTKERLRRKQFSSDSDVNQSCIIFSHKKLQKYYNVDGKNVLIINLLEDLYSPLQPQ